MKNEIIKKLERIEELLTIQKTKPYTFNEASDYLGISKSYLYKLTSGGKIPYYKPFGKKIYFDKAKLDEWVYRNPVKSNAEIEKEAVKYLDK
jgi:excisionase family DNA binding protein